MELPDEERPDVEGLVEELKRRVAARRKEGFYPPGLEEDLDDHFERIVAHRTAERELGTVSDELLEVHEAMGFNALKIPLESSVPGGRVLHRLVSRIVSRQTQGILDQVFKFSQAVHRALAKLEDVFRRRLDSVHLELLGQLDSVTERLAAYERAPEDSGPAIKDLHRRLLALEAAENARQLRPWYSAERFADAFWGNSGELSQRRATIAEIFDGHAPVLDLGCGRGELLEALASRGVEATGVDADIQMVKTATEKGLEVEHDGVVEALAATADKTLGGLALLDVAEYLTPQELIEVVAMSAAKLRPGGVAVVEALNPMSLSSFAAAFHADPARRAPVHPDFLKFLFEEAGFGSVRCEYEEAPPAGAARRSGASAGRAGAEQRPRYRLVATR